MTKVIQPKQQGKKTNSNGHAKSHSKKNANGLKDKSKDKKTKNGVKAKNGLATNGTVHHNMVKEPTLTAEDEKHLQEAIDLAIKSVKNGGGPFGSVIVRDGKVIGRGFNQVTKNHDPTAHGEVVAIRDACKNVKDFELKGATCFTSCEPCPMCLAACYWSRVDRIVFACTKKDAADIGFDDAFIY